MTNHETLSPEAWQKARIALLEQERDLTHRREALAAERRALPWVRVDTDYRFEGASGTVSLGELFDGRSQLAVYHFMFAPDWQAGCKSCSFWADSYNGSLEHLAARDVSLVAVSRAPFAKLNTFRKRMGWKFPWVSSGDGPFNRDFGVFFDEAERSEGRASYNYGKSGFPVADAPGFSVFYKEADGPIFHTYSTYARGLDPVNATYQILDMVPKGRDEKSGGPPMSWVRLHDEYDQ